MNNDFFMIERKRIDPSGWVTIERQWSEEGSLITEKEMRRVTAADVEEAGMPPNLFYDGQEPPRAPMEADVIDEEVEEIEEFEDCKSESDDEWLDPYPPEEDAPEEHGLTARVGGLLCLPPMPDSPASPSEDEEPEELEEPEAGAGNELEEPEAEAGNELVLDLHLDTEDFEFSKIGRAHV